VHNSNAHTSLIQSHYRASVSLSAKEAVTSASVCSAVTWAGEGRLCFLVCTKLTFQTVCKHSLLWHLCSHPGASITFQSTTYGVLWLSAFSWALPSHFIILLQTVCTGHYFSSHALSLHCSILLPGPSFCPCAISGALCLNFSLFASSLRLGPNAPSQALSRHFSLLLHSFYNIPHSE
jgi:hypothetical protein